MLANRSMKTRFFGQLLAGGLLLSTAARVECQTPLKQPASVAGAPSFELVGFATVKAYGVDAVTGGGNTRAVEVRTAQEFRDAVERKDIKKKADQHKSPRVVKVVGDIDLGELANERPGEVITSVGKVEVRSNTTIVGTGEGATIRRGVLDLHGASNVIIRNLNFLD